MNRKILKKSKIKLYEILITIIIASVTATNFIKNFLRSFLLLSFINNQDRDIISNIIH